MTTAMYTKGELGTLALFTTLVIALIGSAIFFGPSITGFATLGNNNCSAILNISNEQYNLTQDLTCTNANPALTINASGITLDCKGWSIKEADLAINLTSYASSTTIRNCIISNTDTFTPNTAAINIASGASLTIQDTTIQGTGYATGILSNATAAVVAENITITLPNGVAAINLTNPNTAGNKIINSTFNKGIYLNNVTIDLIGNTLSTGALLALHLFGNNINATQNTFSSSAQPSIITYNPQSSNVFFYNNRITTGTINLTSVTGLSLCVNNIGNNYTNPSLQAVELTPSVECDVTPPNGTLDSPILVSADTDFFYTPTDQSNVYSGASIASCTLYVWSNTGALITTLTNTTISEGVQNNFTNVSLNEGNYIWNVQCTDDYLFPNIGFIATNQSFIYDATPPQAPILYPQILVKGSKNTNDTTTTIAGYFENDPMVNVTVVVLNQSSDFTFNVTTNVSNQTSNTVLNTEVVTYAAAVNDTVVFLNWSAAVENALNNANNRYLEFSNHNKTYFTRYNVTQVNRTGNEIRVVIDPGLEVAISPGVQVSIFDAPFPNGYFRFDDVDLYVGNNSISAWGTDKAGNAGLAAQDWIVRTANSQGTANPASPILEDLNTSYFNITSLQIYGYVLDNSPDLQVFIFSENSEGSRKQTVVNSSATTANFSSTSTPLTTTQVTIAATKGDTLIRFKETDYDAGLNNATYAGKYIEFSGHNTTHFKRYNITSIINPVGQDPYFVTYPPLESNVSIGETVTIYNEEVPNRWFNATLPIWAGTNTIYAVAKNAQGENISRNLTTTITLPTDSLEITFVNDFGDLTNSKNLSATWTNLSSNPDFTYYEYRIERSDGTVIIDWTPTTNNSANVTINATTQTIYYWKVRAYDSFGLVGNIASSDGILYIDPTPPVALFVLDDGTWQQTKTTFHATWQFEDNESDIILYEYSIGTAQYPDPGFESIVNRTKTTLTDITQSVTLDEGKQYYVNVRAQNGNANYNGSWSNWASSDGIIIDSLPFTGGSLSYFDGDYTASTVTVTYDVGYDQNVSGYPSGFKNASLLRALAPITSIDGNLTCGSFAGFTYLQSVSNNSNSVNAPLESGKCTKFRLIVYDNAGNAVTYESGDTEAVVVNDQTPPSTPSTVVDDGFSTIVQGGLHASWSTSSDPEVGISHYTVKVWEDSDLSNPYSCVNAGVLNTTECSLITETITNTTSTELTIPFTLTHDHKYFFEIYAWNKLGLNSSPAYSDGIVFYDVYAPSTSTIIQVENDTHLSTVNNVYTVDELQTDNNITIIATTDESTNSCVLLDIDIDYTQSGSYSTPCVVSSTANADLTYNVTCNATITSQGYYARHLSCADAVGNIQGYQENTDFFIDYDYPEQPTVSNVTIYKLKHQEISSANVQNQITVTSELTGLNTTTNVTFTDLNPINQTADITINAKTLQDVSIGTLVEVDNFTLNMFFVGSTTVTWAYVKDELFIKDFAGSLACEVNVFDADLDEGQNITSVAFDIYVDGEKIIDQAQFTGKTNNNIYRYDITNVAAIHRGSTITCVANATDNTGNSAVASGSNIVLNSAPEQVNLETPLGGNQIGKNQIFNWSDGFDADGDALYYILEIDNESSFNFANNEKRNLTAITSFVSATGTQDNAAIDRTRVVWADDRNNPGTNDDLYMKDIIENNEQFLVSGSGQINSVDIEGDYITFKDAVGVKLYRISTGALNILSTTGDHPSIDEGTVTYAQAGQIKMYNVASGSTENPVNYTGTLSDAVKRGSLIIYSTNTNTTVYDLVARTSYNLSTPSASISTFGPYVVLSNGTTSRAHNLTDGSSISLGAISTSAILGDHIIGDGANDFIYDLQLGSTTGISNAQGYVIEDDYVIYSTGNLTLATLEHLFPATFGAKRSERNITTSAVDGNYYWRIRVCDQAAAPNSCTVTPARTFQLDTTPPNISITSPTQNQIIADGFTVVVQAKDFADPSLDINYVVRFDNSTIFTNGTLTGSEPIYSGLVNFTPLGNATVYNMTLYVTATDNQGNSNSTSVNFSVNNNLPSFSFGFLEAQVITGDITNTSFAFNVYNSSLKIIGPLPATTQKYARSFSNTTLVTHTYSDIIDVDPWADGVYKAMFTASNLQGFSAENRTFILDRTPPTITAISPANDSTHLTNETLSIMVNSSDANENTVKVTYPLNTTHNTSKEVNGSTITTDTLNLYALINTTVFWSVNVTDKAEQSTVATYQFDVESSAPRYIGITENTSRDEQDPIIINLFAAFEDDDIINNATDTLTFTLDTTPTANISVDINSTTGLVNITDLVEVNVTENLTFRATDLYGKFATGNVTIHFTASDDKPKQNDSLNLDVTEDTNAIDIVDLDNYFVDGDNALNFTFENIAPTLIGDGLYANVTLAGDLLFTAVINITTNTLSIFPAPNASGIQTFAIRAIEADGDGDFTTGTVTVNVTEVNDPPFATNVVLSPPYVSTQNMTLTYTLGDVDGTASNTTINYTINGVEFVMVNDTIPNIGLSDGDVINATVYPIDDQGLAGTPVTSNTIIIDKTAPTLVSTLPQGNTLNNTLINFTTESASCNILLDGTLVNATTNTTQHTYFASGLATGEHTVTSTCTDLAGNTEVLSYNFTVLPTALSILSIVPNATTIIQGEPVNITITINTVEALNAFEINITSPVGLAGKNTTLTFNNTQDTQYYLFTNTTDLGAFNASIFANITSTNATFVNATLFTVYPPVNQEVNIN